MLLLLLLINAKISDMRQTTPENAANIIHQPVRTWNQLGGEFAKFVARMKNAIAKREAKRPVQMIVYSSFSYA
jgi:hypothetical protein